jgi:signal peptidase I
MDDEQDPGTLAPAPAPEPDAGSAKAEPDKDAPAANKKKKKKKSFGRELLTIVVAAAILTLLVKAFIIQVYRIPSASMENTLEVGDRVLVNKVVYHFRGIARGDVIVFSGQDSWGPDAPPPSSDPVVRFADDLLSGLGLYSNQTYYIKRVIGLPGDHVACCDAQGRVTVNGVPLNEGSYLYPGDAPSEIRFNIVVPPGQLWVMGDHRAISDDSRDHPGDPGGGAVPESAVIGRAFVIIWPPSRWRILPIPDTFQQPKLSATAAAAGTPTAQEAAGLLSARLQPSSPALPLTLGFAVAVPVTWLQRRVRLRAARRRAARHLGPDR